MFTSILPSNYNFPFKSFLLFIFLRNLRFELIHCRKVIESNIDSLDFALEPKSIKQFFIFRVFFFIFFVLFILIFLIFVATVRSLFKFFGFVEILKIYFLADVNAFASCVTFEFVLLVLPNKSVKLTDFVGFDFAPLRLYCLRFSRLIFLISLSVNGGS